MEIRIIIDDRIVSFFRRARKPLAWTLGTLAFGAGALAVAAPLTKPFNFEAGDLIRASDINENFDTLFDAWDDHIIRENTTIALTAADGCEALQEALADLSEQVIRDEAIVTIELGAGTYACDGVIQLRHPQGGQIEIVGAGNTADDVELTFPANSVGLGNNLGHSVGLVAHLTLTGATGGAGINARGPRFNVDDLVVQDFEVGVQAQQGGVLIGSNLYLTGNTYGARATTGGHMTLTDSVADTNTYGFHVELGASAAFDMLEASGNANTGFSVDAAIAQVNNSLADGNLDGFYARGGGTLVGDFLTASNNSGDGFEVTWGGFISADDPTADGNTAYGFFAHNFSALDLSSTTSTGNSWGFVAETGGRIRAGAMTVSGNVAGDYSPAVASLTTATTAIY